MKHRLDLTKVVAPLGEIRRLRHLLQPRNRFTFLLERLLLRGAHYRLLIIAAMIGLVALVGGLLALLADGGFAGPDEAVWWAFLRLTDPGYLGDDEGAARRVISTVITVAGYVFFMGALIAILTQWLTQTIRNLERGLTPIAQRDHLLVLGWTNRTPAVVHELILSEERVRRFLRRRGARRLRVVILAGDVDPGMVQELADDLGPDWDPNQVIFRSGSPLHIDHLARVAFLQAGAVILPSADYGQVGAGEQDAATVKALLSISRHGRLVDGAHLPLVVTEIFDPRKLHVARRAYGGRVEIVLSGHFISRLIAQAVRHPGMAAVFGEILGHGSGSELYVRTVPELTGHPFDELPACFPHGVLLGVVRPSGDSFQPILNPPPGFVVESDDRFVVLAASYGGADPDVGARVCTARGEAERIPEPAPARRRLLVLGWNRKIPSLLLELEDYEAERFEVIVVSNVSLADREHVAAILDLQLERTQVQHRVRDYTSVGCLRDLEPASYDTVLIAASEWLDTDEEADARSVLATLLLHDEIGSATPAPNVVVELMDAENVHLVGAGVQHIVSPVVISHILAQVALRRELRAVYDELFGPGGAEIVFRPVGDYALPDRAVTFEEIGRTAHAHGEIALGVRRDGQVRLNPPRREEWTFADDDQLVVVTTFASAFAEPERA